MRRIKLFWNKGGSKPAHRRFYYRGHMPVRQTLIWVGPVFILIQPKQRKEA